MKNKAVFGIARDRLQAESAATDLKTAGFVMSDISVLWPDRHGNRDVGHEKSTKAPEGAVAGASAAGVVGGVLGLLAGIGTLAIPGLGPFIAAGPIMAALSGLAVGGVAGGLAGALVGLGIPEIEAKHYEGKIRDGNIFIAVHAETSKEIDAAKRIFKQHRLTDVGSTEESRVDSKQRVG